MPIMNSGRWSDHLGRIKRSREETENRDAFISQARGNALKVSDQVSDPGYQSGIRENKRKHERTLAREKSVMDLENEKTLRSLPSATDLSREKLGREDITSREKISREGITSRENIARIGSGRMSSGDRKYMDESNTENFMGKYGITDYNGTFVSEIFTDEQMKIMQTEAAEKGLNIYFDKGQVKGIAPNVSMPNKLGSLTEGTNDSVGATDTTNPSLYSYRDERGKSIITDKKADIPEKYMQGVKKYQSGSSTNSGQLLSELSDVDSTEQSTSQDEISNDASFMNKLNQATPEQKQTVMAALTRRANQGDLNAKRILASIPKPQEKKVLERIRPQTPSAYSRNPSVLTNWNKTGLPQVR